MRPHPRRFAFVGFILFAAFLAGCGQPVREDRSINWSKEGGSVGFQHGQEGVFLADKDGRNLTKIYQPDAQVIATSTPIWSPTGKRVLFTTAHSRDGQPQANWPSFLNELDPEGKIHLQQDIVYTCWLYEQPEGGKPAAPVALFEATADHPGYVAANLAVRWHPCLERIDYVQEVAPHQHGLFEYDLASKQSRQVLPQTSEALIFDWTPDGSHLACVLGSSHGATTDGIWVGDGALTDWWHVPHPGELAPGEFGSLLEKLRSTRPAWTLDGDRFAFSSCEPAVNPRQPGRHCLRHATLATRKVDVWAAGDRPFRDLVWDKAGIELGVVCGREGGSLHLIQQGRALSPPVNQELVRRFAGWIADGERLAYVVPDRLSEASEAPWALLLIPDPSSRDQVYVAAGNGSEPGQPVFSGMRVTFPQWSPQEDKLSLWVTFKPAYRSVISHLLGWGLRPGDPAAVFDVKSGQLGWLPVNPEEKVQVGHYYLLKKDYAQAWRWYQEAERESPQPKPVEVRDFMDYLQALRGPRDFSFFQYYCLTKLGRADEARAKLAQFRRFFLPKFVEPANGQFMTVDGRTLEQHLHELLDPRTLVGSLLQDLYMAEVFLSLDAAGDGEAFFRAALAGSDSEAGRLSRAIVLGQILLLNGKYQEYADLAIETIAPLFNKLLASAPAGGSAFPDSTTVSRFAGELALLPLAAPEFLGLLPDAELQGMAPRWEKLRANANTASRPVVDLVLRGLYQTLGKEDQRRDAETRLKTAPAQNFVLPIGGDARKGIVDLHAQMLVFLHQN